MRYPELSKDRVELARSQRDVLEAVGRSGIERYRQPPQLGDIVSRHGERPDVPSPRDPPVEDERVTTHDVRQRDEEGRVAEIRGTGRTESHQEVGDEPRFGETVPGLQPGRCAPVFFV